MESTVTIPIATSTYTRFVRDVIVPKSISPSNFIAIMRSITRWKGRCASWDGLVGTDDVAVHQPLSTPAFLLLPRSQYSWDGHLCSICIPSQSKVIKSDYRSLRYRLKVEKQREMSWGRRQAHVPRIHLFYTAYAHRPFRSSILWPCSVVRDAVVLKE